MKIRFPERKKCKLTYTEMKTVLIGNRGEIACRIIRSCKYLGLFAVEVFSDTDRGAVHVEMPDHACHLGGAKPRIATSKETISSKLQDALTPIWSILAMGFLRKVPILPGRWFKRG